MSRIDPTAVIHPQALIEDGAQIGPGARVGPFALIGGEVELGANVEVMSHVVIKGRTRVGEETQVFPFAVLGEIPQDLKFGGERTELQVGARNRIREHVTMNLGTSGGGSVTKVGDDCLFMAGVHVAHDCIVGNRVIMVNNSALAGHCVLGDGVIVGGLSGVHQFVRIGEGAIIGAVTMVTADVIPHALVQGPRGMLDGLNLVGLKRRGVGRTDIMALRAALQTLKQGEGAFQDRARRLGEETESDYVRQIVDFVLGNSDRGFLTP
ncbi:acyl-[acyl-carrier-protein]--UDP-N-acetylglucosamine O-acyltransferase [Palleronia marisminoris]|uniref:Acyl-[acyl-carrier-protein]--UDP-N-acetylglucosamine O-acyltransferase n=1 Tax=Palleronia marisminoris TaxID=315423 RepID=A0A1Y5R9L0_9RHOB|nr:acyl-ACP--UDP-N-acetylglucosamine O-acyltransferase [Palleronia marisminoris]SFG08423.1 acyl-[acyl-carrier-protein]--UDP-N-acetylglucosamine O-acyltransferase [Palleronia marisminoris]SLN11596.1 Acyl-[acyl-carrier-protein]--UDP-N-acetylglucosamine O-acyltransferase [Palleronia marisminoris]